MRRSMRRRICLAALFGSVPFAALAMDTADLPRIAITLVILVISLSFHEAAHAWVALKCGDTTGRDLGRITLNPLPHIDPFMTIILPGIMMATSGMIFGGAKPVPVAFHRLRHPWRDMSLVALAGPLSNILLAVLFVAGWHLFVRTGWYNGAAGSIGERRFDLLPQVLNTAAEFNVLLAVFNLVPIPPLDGSRVMSYLLPSELREPYGRLESFGILIVFGLIMFVPVVNLWLHRAINVVLVAIDSAITLGGRL